MPDARSSLRVISWAQTPKLARPAPRLGSYNWNTLLTTDAGHYESGAFDVRAGSPRPTALAGLLRDLAAGVGALHPVVESRSPG